MNGGQLLTATLIERIQAMSLPS